MPYFNYEARKGPKEIVKGVLEAASLEEALEQMDSLGLLPLKMEETTEAKPNQKISKQVKPSVQAVQKSITLAPVNAVLKYRVKSSLITAFAYELSSLLRAGVPILRALATIAEQTESKKFRQVVEMIVEDIKNGRQISESLVRFTKIFPSVDVAIVRAGENGGVLPDVLSRIASYRQKNEETLSRVRSAMVYPTLMAFTGIGTVVFMMVFVIPKLSSLFSSMGSELPAITQFVMNVSHFLQQKSFWAMVAFFIAGGVILAKTKANLVWGIWSRVSLKLPVIRHLIIEIEMVNFARTFGLLLKSGILILKAIEVTTPVFKNLVLREAFAKTYDQVASGRMLGQSLRETKVFPVFMTNLVAVGEESGKLDEMMQEIASVYERKSDEMIKIATSLLEPLMILMMGLIAGVIVIAMLLPMFELNNLVQ